jgi:hypothetical protein
MSLKKKILIGIGGVVGLFTLLGIVGAIVGPPEDGDDQASLAGAQAAQESDDSSPSEPNDEYVLDSRRVAACAILEAGVGSGSPDRYHEAVRWALDAARESSDEAFKANVERLLELVATGEIEAGSPASDVLSELFADYCIPTTFALPRPIKECIDQAVKRVNVGLRDELRECIASL